MSDRRGAYIDVAEKARRALVAAMVVMVAIMGYYVWDYNARKPDRIKPAPVKTVSEADVVAYGVELTEYVDEHTLWNLQADEALIYSQSKTTLLRRVAADFFDEEGVKSLHVISDSGVKDDITGNITASGNVEADALVEGVHLTTDELSYDAETQFITSEARVVLTRGAMITSGEGLKADIHLNNVRILRDVETVLGLPDPTAPPVVITADALQLAHGAQIATYTGRVVVKQGNMDMRANVMRVFLGPADAGEQSADVIERIEVFGDVVISQDQALATGETGEYTGASHVVVLTGTPDKQAYAEDRATFRSIAADVIRVYLETNDFEGEGNVKFLGLPGIAPEP